VAASHEELKAENVRLREALERVIEEFHETSDLSGRRKLDFEQKATNAAVIARQAFEGDGDA
jgi:hypothetical protein